MNHPELEELALYASDEVTSEQRSTLSAHLRECARCTADLASLRRTTQRLETWEYSPAAHGSVLSGVMKWGIAAALLLGVGFAGGTWATYSRGNTAAVRAEIEKSVRSSVENHLRRTLNEADLVSSSTLAAAETRLRDSGEERLNHVLGDVIAAMNSAREADRNVMQLLLETISEQHEKDVRWLRADLETLASNADDEIKLARFQLRQLSARNQISDAK